MYATLLQTVPNQPDITIESSARRTVLVVECKFAVDESPAAAAGLRNRLLAKGYVDVPSDSFFMLALPSMFYLWKPGAGVAADVLPTCSSSAMPILRSYMGRLADKTPWPGNENIQLAVSSWLSDLAAAIRKPEASEADRMLVDCGVYDLMRGGGLRPEFES